MNKKSKGKAISPISGASIPVPGPGRRKGSKNKISHTAKENVALVFEMLGGTKGMFSWASRNDHNRAMFYQSIYPKIISQELDHSGNVAVDAKLTVEFVETRG